MTDSKEKELKYEEALKRLERLVAELDTSELDLESRLKKFEEGTKLARLLVKKLDQAKKKVQTLVKTGVGDETLTTVDDHALGGDHSQTDDEALA